jgi:hypothetical protein
LRKSWTPAGLALVGSSGEDFWPQTRHHIKVRSTTNMVMDIDVDAVYNAVDQLLFERGRKVYGI